MGDLIQTVRDKQADFQTIANADCSASWIAQSLLEAADIPTEQEHESEGQTSYDEADTTENTITVNTEPQNEREKGIFDY